MLARAPISGFKRGVIFEFNVNSCIYIIITSIQKSTSTINFNIYDASYLPTYDMTQYSTEVSTMIFFKQFREERFPLFLLLVFATSSLLLLVDVLKKLERSCT